MLTIERKTVKKAMKIGDLAHALNVGWQPLDVDGDRILDVRGLGIKVLAPNVMGHHDTTHFVDVEAVRITRPEQVWRLTTSSRSIMTASGWSVERRRLECAGEHLLHVKGEGPQSCDWKFVKDLKVGDELNVKTCYVTGSGGARERQDSLGEVYSVEMLEGRVENLYDLQVAEVNTDGYSDSDVFKHHRVGLQPVTHAYYTNDIVSHNSHALVAFGAGALLAGLNVNHYTFELSETAVGLRYDSHLTGIPSNEVPLMKDEVVRLEDNMRLGRLLIKGYPTGTATIQTLRAHIERTTLEGRKPDILLIDYADIMRSTRRFDAPRFELKLIYEELRNLAMDLGVPVWTASQSNREAANSDIVGLENMSEAYGKAMVADVVISLSRKPQEKATGLGRLFIAKNRAGRDGIVFPVKINTATSTITVIEGSDALSLVEAQQRDESDIKDILRRKWAELKRDRSIPSKPLERSTQTTVAAEAAAGEV